MASDVKRRFGSCVKTGMNCAWMMQHFRFKLTHFDADFVCQNQLCPVAMMCPACFAGRL